MHYSSYSHVCHFLLQDPSWHCTEYYASVSSDSSINQDFCLVCGVWPARRDVSVDAENISFQKERKVCFCFRLLPICRAQVSGDLQNSADNTIMHCLCRASPGAQNPPFRACHVLMLPMSASNKGEGTVQNLHFVVVKTDLFGALCGHSEPLSKHNSPLGSPQAKNE